MWKQLLSKLPRKSGAPNSGADLSRSHSTKSSTNATTSTENPNQRLGGGSTLSSKAAAVKRMSSAIFPSGLIAGIEPFIPFIDVPNAEKQQLFLSKLDTCCVLFDFSDHNDNSVEKEMKRQALVELLDYVNNESSRFSEPVVDAFCNMFAINLFRVFPPKLSSGSSHRGGENEEEGPMFEPAWSHLQIVYELLLKFVNSPAFDMKNGKKYIDQSFILRLLDLFDSEDPRERDCVKTVLHRIYGKFMIHRPFIRKSVSNIFYHFVFETEKHNGIAELLEIFGSVISGFALPLKEEHMIFLWKALIPLHKPKSIGVYFQQLTFCTIQYIRKEPKLTSAVVIGLLKYWPITSSQKELMFLSELEEVLEAIDPEEFQKCMLPLFRRIKYCLNSPHFQVAERALYLWNNDRMINLISQNRQSILPLIVPALERNARGHWNRSVLHLTLSMRKLFSEMDEGLYVACQSNFEGEEEGKRAEEEKRRTAWELLETAAFKSVVTSSSLLLAVPIPVSPPVAAIPV